jgi:carbon monoxide dehydrogenase subunit G
MTAPQQLGTLLVFLLLAGGAAPALAQEVIVDASRDGEYVVIEASAELQADVRIVWQTLSDYDRLAEFIPNLKSSRVVSRSAEGVVLEQQGEYSFLFFSRPVDVRLLVVESPPHRIVSRAIGGSFRDMSGVYELSPVPGGVKLRYSGRILPNFDLPPVFGVIAARAAAYRQFRGMVDEIVRRAAKAP